jgi:hypothetical protein
MLAFLTNRLFLGASAITMAVCLVGLSAVHVSTAHDLKTVRADLVTCTEARAKAEATLSQLATDSEARITDAKAATAAAKAQGASYRAEATALLGDVPRDGETDCDAADRLLTSALTEGDQ